MFRLILVQFKEAWLSYHAGETASFSQAIADHLVSRGLCERVGTLDAEQMPRESDLEAADPKLARVMMRLRGERILE